MLEPVRLALSPATAFLLFLRAAPGSVPASAEVFLLWPDGNPIRYVLLLLLLLLLQTYRTVSESEPQFEPGGVGGKHGLLSRAARAEFCTAVTVLVGTPLTLAVVTVRPGSCATRAAGEIDKLPALLLVDVTLPNLERLLPTVAAAAVVAPLVEFSKSELPAAPPMDVNCSSRSLSSKWRVREVEVSRERERERWGRGTEESLEECERERERGYS